MMKRILILLVAASIFPAISCKSSGSGDSTNETATQEFPSVEGTTWTVKVKWSEDSDTALFRPRFDAGGKGAQVDTTGQPTKLTFTWTQEKETVSWAYPSTVNFTGTISSDGQMMTGTGSYKTNKASWTAVRK